MRSHCLFLLGVVGKVLGVLKLRASGARTGEMLAQFVCGQVGAVGWSSGLLPPRLVQAAVVHGVKAQLLDQGHDFLLGRRIVAGHRQGDAAGRAGGQTLVLEVVGVDVVEYLHHRAAQVLLTQSGFRRQSGT